eukprot:CAMPEP_0194258768 /NCGR_PEP_ID=MMETSP0158-20130606/42025_1 /TAXON_ID=33649 /ORGANISM="Thalassionema nitzschioides, Strain L26-B" /LENGTH=31 /DNA_ID= /DNA_START= /DNA_END= /DNA_ORIENTATION=
MTEVVKIDDSCQGRPREGKRRSKRPPQKCRA